MNPAQLYGIAFLVAGAIMGSFGNMLIYRLPAALDINGRSKCPKCKKILAPSELVPIVSYLWLRGCCRHCRQVISPRYLAVEIASAALFYISFWHISQPLPAAILALALWCLLIIVIIDFMTQGIPDILSFPFVGLSLVYGYMLQQLDPYVFAVGTGFFALQWLVSWGRWVGSGDVLISLGISALLGRIDLALVMLGTSYISGAVAAAYLMANKNKTGRDRLAFGPFMGIGTVVALLYGDAIMQFLFHV